MPFRFIFVTIAIFFVYSASLAQKKGCTDVQAANFDSSAMINDGSCIYNTTDYVPRGVCPKLNDSLIETSGLIYFNNHFWSLNDGGNEPAIYEFDSTNGAILHRTTIANKSNIDWEEMTQDSLNIYIGDFGNNAGDRKDLKIYILKKADLKFKQKTDTVYADEILFNYSDQTSFVPANQNHNFDMEAMCVIGDSIHMFSKNWVDKKTRHYVMSKFAGNYSLIPRESFDVDGQITSACTNEKGDKIILGGYNSTNGACFIWMLWNFSDYNVFNGNKRRIGLGSVLSLGQYEATAFRDGKLYFTDEKKFTEAGLWRAEINQWFINKPHSGLKKLKIVSKFVVFQKDSDLIVETKNEKGLIYIYNATGVKLISHRIAGDTNIIHIGQLPSGIYSVEINDIVQKIMIEN